MLNYSNNNNIFEKLETRVKATSVYMSQFQLIPLARVHDYLSDQMGLPVAKGSVSNWNYAIYKKFEFFEIWTKNKLIYFYINNVDETGINIIVKKHLFIVLAMKR